MALDASGLGMVCAKACIRQDMEIVLGALGGGDDGLVLTKDITFNLEFVDEGKSLAMVGEKVVSSKAEAIEAFQRHDINPNGKFKAPVKLAFCDMKAMRETSDSIGQDIKKKDKEKEEREERERDAQEIAELGPLSYYPTKADWALPETTGDDSRKDDTRFVSGGPPQRLATDVQNSLGAAKPKSRAIVKYMMGEPDENGNRKVYIEEPEVVSCDRSRIRVEFTNTTYGVRVDSGAGPLVLGPLECGQINLEATSWRLSPGKRLTISLVKASTSHKLAPGRAKHEDKSAASAKAAGAEPDQSASRTSSRGEMAWVVASMIPVLLAFVCFYVFHAQG